MHYFSTPQHYIAVVVYHDSTLTSYFPFISVLLAAVRLILQSYMGGSSFGKHECETTGFGEGERKEKW